MHLPNLLRATARVYNTRNYHMNTKLAAALLFSVPAVYSIQGRAADGVVLINQASVIAAGGFPFKITQPGSYRLSSNLTVPATGNGLVIDSSNVTLDLNGFSVACLGGAFAGVTSDYSPNTFYSNVKVAHGTVTGCGYGVNFLDVTFNVEIDGVTASNYQTGGIAISVGAVRRCFTTGGTAPSSVGITSQYGIVESNTLGGDSVGIFLTGGGRASITANFISASQTAIESGAFIIYGSNVFFAQQSVVSSHGSAFSLNNNLCNQTLC
jgi:hypothetical protein